MDLILYWVHRSNGSVVTALTDTHTHIRTGPILLPRPLTREVKIVTVLWCHTQGKFPCDGSWYIVIHASCHPLDHPKLHPLTNCYFLKDKQNWKINKHKYTCIPTKMSKNRLQKPNDIALNFVQIMLSLPDKIHFWKMQTPHPSMY